VERFDRARALEASWEDAWKSRMGNDRWRNFRCAVEGRSRASHPVAPPERHWVETGKRMIASNLAVDAGIFTTPPTSSPHRLPDCGEHRGTLSARFTYVSPAGRCASGTRRRSPRISSTEHISRTPGPRRRSTSFRALLAGREAEFDFVVVYVNNDPGEPETTTANRRARRRCDG